MKEKSGKIKGVGTVIKKKNKNKKDDNKKDESKIKK